MSIPVVCLEPGCDDIALPGKPRCAACARRREMVRNAQPKRRAYADPRYRAQPKHGVCHLCGLPGADTRDHLVPIAVQMERWGRVRDHRARPAHRACNSGRGSKSSEGFDPRNPALPDSHCVRVSIPQPSGSD